MSRSVRLQPLIIGIGNPLRSDDGLGWAVTEYLSRDQVSGYDIQTVHQLTPELAQWMATASLVVMIDANREGKPGEMCIRPLYLPAQQSSVSTHFTTPEELMLLTSAVYGQCPPVMLVTLVGEEFNIGERLSPTVAAKIPIVSMVVVQLCAENR